MEVYDVLFMKAAAEDLEEIFEYISYELTEPKTAQNTVDLIEKEISSLSTLPRRCPERNIGVYAGKGYRELVVKNFTVIYRIDEEKKRVLIVTIRYSRSSF